MLSFLIKKLTDRIFLFKSVNYCFSAGRKITGYRVLKTVAALMNIENTTSWTPIGTHKLQLFISGVDKDQCRTSTRIFLLDFETTIFIIFLNLSDYEILFRLIKLIHLL